MGPNVGLTCGLTSTMLTDLKARKMLAGRGALSVGGVTGLYLRAGASHGRGKFIIRFVSPSSGKRRDMGIGTYHEIGLAEARRIAMEAQEQIAKGIDPIDARIRASEIILAQSQVPTFRTVAKLVHAALVPSYRNSKHCAQWMNTIETYAFPSIGERRVDSLTTADFAALLSPIWLTKSETAGRVKQRCDRVMMWCVAQRYCSANPVSAVAALLPAQRGTRQRVVHHPAVPWRNLPGVVCRSIEASRITVGRDALMFLIFTAARSGEVRGAKWQEFDLERQTWTIPANRMKAGQIHRVPLSTQACQIIRWRLPFQVEGPFVFSHQGTRPISDMTLTAILRAANIPSDSANRTATAHGFRSSFRDWASENGYARDLAERALAHTIRDATEASYHRTDHLEQRSQMMQNWGNFVVSGVDAQRPSGA